MSTSEIDQLLAQNNSKARPVTALSPAEQQALPKGKIAITIDRNGQWFYRGEPFKRSSMVVMLSQSLVRIEEKYFLIAPEQCLEISVEDLPFVTVKVEQSADKEKMIVGISNGELIEIGPHHPLSLQGLPNSGQQIPIIRVRDNLHARFSRACYYQIVDWSVEAIIDGIACAAIKSNDQYYSIGASQ